MRTIVYGLVAILALGADFASAGLLEEIKARGKLMVGVDAACGGAICTDEKGKIVGHDPDVSALIAKELGVQLEFVSTAWDGVIPALYAKRFDMILSAMTISKGRLERVNFSMPYSDSSAVIVTRATDNRIKSPQDLSGKIVASQAGTPVFVFLKRQEDELKAAGLPGFRAAKDYDNLPEIFLDLANERIDATILPRPQVLGLMAKRPGTFKIATTLKYRRYNGAAFRKEDNDLLDFVNQVLKKAKGDGTLVRLQIKWFGGSMGTLPDEWVPLE